MARLTSNLAAYQRRLEEAARAGLIAAAYVYYNELKRRLRGGYTTGEYVTGYSINSITVAPPTRTADGWTVKVGSNVLYMLLWELGWSPRSDSAIAGLAGGALAGPTFRVEVWRPALYETAEAQHVAFARVFQRVMGGDAAPDLVQALATEAGAAESRADEAASRARLTQAKVVRPSKAEKRRARRRNRKRRKRRDG